LPRAHQHPGVQLTGREALPTNGEIPMLRAAVLVLCEAVPLPCAVSLERRAVVRMLREAAATDRGADPVPPVQPESAAAGTIAAPLGVKHRRVAPERKMQMPKREPPALQSPGAAKLKPEAAVAYRGEAKVFRS